MSVFLSPCVCTLVLILYDICFEKTRRYAYYLGLFFLILGLNGLFSFGSCSACECNKKCDLTDLSSYTKIEIDIEMLKQFDAYNDHQIKYFKEKLAYHTQAGQTAFRNAEKISLLIPNVSDRDIAKSLFKNAIILSMSAKESWAGVIISLTSMFCDYGLCVYDEWTKIQFHLNESKYHFEMKEFYEQVLSQA